MKKPKYHFEPGRHGKPQERSFLAFDTETNPVDGAFIYGAFYGELKTSHGTEIVAEVCDDVEQFRQTFLEIEKTAKQRKRGFILVGFNTSYDLVYLGDIVASPSRLDAGSRFIQAKTVNGTKIYDISNHVVGSLKEWMHRLHMEERYGIHKREGYLDDDNLKREQVLDDARATWILTAWVQDRHIHKFGISMPSTKFSSALRLFQNHYFQGEWYRSEADVWKNEFERESYYGGRCEIFERGELHVNSYDVNSMYVSIMRDNPVPDPTKAVYLKDSEKIQQLIETDFMTVDCRVRVPRTRIGLLPYRHPELSKLVFPYGEWRGTYNSVELREALRWGLEIVEIYRALWYPESDYYFREYAQMTLDGRQVARLHGDDADEQLFKYLGNGLYGKFAQRNTIGGRYIRLSQFEGELEGLCVIPDPGNPADAWVELPVVRLEDSYHTFPVIAATITAYARAKMLHALCSNADTVVYCDTDSIKTLGEAAGIDVGNLPGQWKFEYSKTQWFYRAKFYGDKIKGVSKGAKTVYEDEEVKVFEWERPVKFRTSVRSQTTQNVWQTCVKSLNKRDDKRVWITDTDSWPLYVYEERVYNNLYSNRNIISTGRGYTKCDSKMGLLAGENPSLRG